MTNWYEKLCVHSDENQINKKYKIMERNISWLYQWPNICVYSWYQLNLLNI